MGYKMKRKNIFYSTLPFFCLGIFFAKFCFAVNPSDGIVSEAKKLIGARYVNLPPPDNEPPNKDDIYGGTFDLSNWTKDSGVDCSGLTSYAGGLRRHYT